MSRCRNCGHDENAHFAMSLYGECSVGGCECRCYVDSSASEPVGAPEGPSMSVNEWGQMDCGCGALAQDGQRCEYHTRQVQAKAGAPERRKGERRQHVQPDEKGRYHYSRTAEQMSQPIVIFGRSGKDRRAPVEDVKVSDRFDADDVDAVLRGGFIDGYCQAAVLHGDPNPNLQTFFYEQAVRAFEESYPKVSGAGAGNSEAAPDASGVGDKEGSASASPAERLTSPSPAPVKEASPVNGDTGLTDAAVEDGEGRDDEMEADQMIRELENATADFMRAGTRAWGDYHSPEMLRVRNAREQLRHALLRAAPAQQDAQPKEPVRMSEEKVKLANVLEDVAVLIDKHRKGMEVSFNGAAAPCCNRAAILLCDAPALATGEPVQPSENRGWHHDASVGDLPDGSYRAVCICGWTGGRYLIRSSCQQNAEEHNFRLNPIQPVQEQPVGWICANDLCQTLNDGHSGPRCWNCNECIVKDVRYALYRRIPSPATETE